MFIISYLLCVSYAVFPTFMDWIIIEIVSFLAKL